MIIYKLGIFTIVFAILVIIVNMCTEIFKKCVKNKEIPTKLFILAVSIALTVITTIAFCQIYSIPIVWYLIVGSIVIGVIVAYCAIFGYDNLYGELMELISSLFGKIGSKNKE